MFTGYTQENRKKRHNTEVDTAVAETQKSPKRIRLQENKKDVRNFFSLGYNTE
jgi:hypothetical protein